MENRSWVLLGGSLPGLGFSIPVGTVSKEHELVGACCLDHLERLPQSPRVKAEALTRTCKALYDPPLPPLPL